MNVAEMARNRPKGRTRMSIVNEKIEDAFNKFKEEFNRKGFAYSGTGVEIFKAGYEAAMKEIAQEGTLEILPCDCHLFEKQVCDHCQGLLLGYRKCLRDVDAPEGGFPCKK